MYYMFSIQLTNCIWCLSHLFLLSLTITPPRQCVGSTHPTGMHSSFHILFLFFHCICDGIVDLTLE